MSKILFLDRDGTIIEEPVKTQQVDSVKKLKFEPNVISSLSKISKEFDYKLVMVTNQDGLGTKSFPEETFWPAHNVMLEILRSEGIVFEDIFIDKSFDHENIPTRKPDTQMLSKYVHGNFDRGNSFVIGDGATDMQLAENLKAKKIFYGNDLSIKADLSTSSWSEIYQFLKLQPRTSEVQRLTDETQIAIKLNLDYHHQTKINTGIGFLDHMLEQLAKHAKIGLIVDVIGDLHIDTHHTIEDLALAIGEAFNDALGSKRGIGRYGFVLPMDDCLTQVAIDFGGRPWLVWDVEFKREKIGSMPTEMFMHFFKSFTDTAKCNLNIQSKGKIEHHKIESIFKAFAKSIRMAINTDQSFEIPSTKGVL
jgi:imidazoleglycerol-phosphate dehydratase/histidinol-phosphatase